jgi:hypothetical protein
MKIRAWEHAIRRSAGDPTGPPTPFIAADVDQQGDLRVHPPLAERRRRPADEPVCAGFTRVDALAIVSVVALLGGVLLPALARDQSHDTRSYCVFRLGQIAKAMALYAADSQEWLPPNPDDGNTTPYRNWFGGISAIGGGQEFNTDLPSDRTRALLAPYLTDPSTVYRCPADRRLGVYQGADVRKKGQRVPPVRTISLNGGVGTNPYRGQGKVAVDGPWLDGNHAHVADRTWYCYGSMSDFVRPGPSRTFTFLEEDPRSINDGTFAMVGPSTPQLFRLLDWPATYHDMACAVAFADGHAEMHRWLDSRTKLTTSGFVSSQLDNPDVVWLAQRASALIKGGN